MRRDEIREKGLAHKALMYKTRFIWLKNPRGISLSTKPYDSAPLNG